MSQNWVKLSTGAEKALVRMQKFSHGAKIVGAAAGLVDAGAGILFKYLDRKNQEEHAKKIAEIEEKHSRTMAELEKKQQALLDSFEFELSTLDSNYSLVLNQTPVGS